MLDRKTATMDFWVCPVCSLLTSDAEYDLFKNVRRFLSSSGKIVNMVKIAETEQ